MWIECRAPVDAAVAVRQAGEWEALDAAHISVRTDRAPDAVLAAVRDELDGRLRG